MPHWRPSLSGPVSDDDLAGTPDTALVVLAEVGVECTDPEIGGQLEAWPGAEYREGRARFRGSTVRERLETHRASAPPDPAEVSFLVDMNLAAGRRVAALRGAPPVPTARPPAPPHPPPRPTTTAYTTGGT